MSFTTQCYIRTNTPELRKKLEDLGYKCYGNPFQITNTSRLITTLDGEYVPYNVQLDNSWMDCGTNEPLFLAIAALRDDTDYMQWFVTEVDQHWMSIQTYAPKGSFELCLVPDRNMGNPLLSNGNIPAHKATVDELINHFKENKKHE